MVTSILTTNQLGFSNDELPPEERGHIKALHISVKTNDMIVSCKAKPWAAKACVRPMSRHAMGLTAHVYIYMYILFVISHC